MFNSLKRRKREDEWMDAPDADPTVLARSLSFIRRVNRLLGYTRATLFHLEKISRNWNPGQEIHLLDVATGSGDIPREILRWATRHGFKVRITAVDLHHQTLRTAAQFCDEPEIHFVRGDATRLPFSDRAFDCVLTSMFLHHLDEPAAVAVLRELDRVTDRGVIVADLLRTPRAYFWISFFTMLANPMVKHDARVSVSGAFNQTELLALRDAAGLNYLKPSRHFGHRLVLAGTKPE